MKLPIETNYKYGWQGLVSSVHWDGLAQQYPYYAKLIEPADRISKFGEFNSSTTPSIAPSR